MSFIRKQTSQLNPRFKAFWLVKHLVIAFIGLLVVGSGVAWAAPIPTATVPPAHSEFIGESFTLPNASANPPASDSLCFDNTGDATGYQPGFELITPAGVTLNSATYLGSPVSSSLAQTCSTVGGCTFTNPDTNTLVNVANGETFRVLRFPLGSFTDTQPPQCMTLNLSLGNSPTVQLGVAKNITARPFFDLGKDALDNPASDPPIFGTLQTIVINPTVIKHTKNIISPEDETATGPNYVRTVSLTVDVATGETINPVTVTDILPSSFQFVAITSDAGCTPTSTLSTATPGGTLTLNCGSITGVLGVDKTITYTFYIPKNDASSTPVLNATTPSPNPITNTSTTNGTYLGNALPGVDASDTITAKAVALQKSGAIVPSLDTGPSGLSSGDTVEYTLNGQVSDYFTVGDLTVIDTLGDGQTYDGTFTPKLALQSNGQTVVETTFSNTEVTVAAKTTAGTTPVTFDLSAAISRLIAGSGGQLVGDGSSNPLGQDQTTFIIKLRSTIDSAYTSPDSYQGTATLSANDIVTNTSDVRFTVPGGDSVTEGTSSSLTIAEPALTKIKYAYNGNATPPLPDPFLLAAGDTTTYRLTTTLPVSSVENFKLTDYLPIPLYSVPVSASFINAGLCAGGAANPTPPASNSWCYTSSDTVSSTAPTVTTTPSLNRIIWDYGNREVPAQGGKIDILYTLTATAEPMADRLNLANLAIQSYQDSISGAEQSAATTTQVTTKEPQLAIKKEFYPAAPLSHGNVSGSPPSGYDAQATGLDAGDTVKYLVRITNTGSAPAFGIRVTDNAGTLTPSPFSSCSAPAITLGDGTTAVTTTGNLFTTTATAGMTITPSLAGDGDGTVETNEEIWITYTCTLAANATPRTTPIDNTAQLQYYTNINPASPPLGLTPINFANNTQQLTRKAQLTTQGIQSITKSITSSSLPGSTPNSNINNGETLTFSITVTLSEGTYNNFSFTDNTTTIPSTITCGSSGFTCTNVNVAGTQITVPATTGSTAGTIIYSYSDQKSAGGTNTATVGSDGVATPFPKATTSWTKDDPNPAISKTLTPATNLNAGDTVTINLGWSNTDTGNPMFRCVIKDVLNPAIFDIPTSGPTAATAVTPVTTPTNYTFNYDPLTGTVTYTYVPPVGTPDAPCPTVAAGGAKFSVRIKSDVVTGQYTNKATIDSFTVPPSVITGGATISASVNANVPILAPTVNSKIVTATSLADTTGANVAIGEVITYQLTFRMAEGITNAVKLIDQIYTGTTTAQLVYIPGSARLSRSSTTLSAANNPGSPGSINTAPVGTSVAVLPTLSGSNLTINLGDVTNSDANSATSENYILEAQFRVGNVVANSGGVSLQNRAQITYTPAGGAATTVSGSPVTEKVVTPKVGISKVVTPAAAVGGDTVLYTLTVLNEASGATAASAYDYVFSDILPADLIPTTIPAAPSANVGSTGATVTGLGFSSQTLSGSIDKLDPGESVTITYYAKVSATAPFGKVLTNNANATATTLPGADANERTGSGTGPNDLFAGANASVTTDTVTMTKTIKNPKASYAIGEEIEYELRIALPVGTATNMKVEDKLPDGLGYVTNSGAITHTGGVTAPTDAAITPAITNPSPPATLLTFSLGNATANPAGEVVLNYRAKVSNVAANQDGVLRTNNVRVVYDNPNPGGPTPLSYTAPNPPTARIGEPNLAMTKTIVSGAADGIAQGAGDIVRWQFTISNNGDTAARQVAIKDVLPGNMAALDMLTIPATPNITVSTIGTVGTEAGGTVSASDFTVTTTNLARDTLSATDLVLEPRSTLTVEFDTVIGTNASAADPLDNKVTATYNSLPQGVTGGRDATDGGDDDNNTNLNNYQESASHALKIQSLIAIDKQVSPVAAAVGGTITYQLRIDVIQGQTNSVVVTDKLPAGLEYLRHSITVGNMGIVLTNPSSDTNTGTLPTLRFDLGDVVNPANGKADDDYVLVEIDARVLNTPANQNGVDILNGDATGSPVTVSYNDGSAQTVNFDHDASTPGNQGIPFKVVEPVLGVTKTANPASQALGDVVTYTLNIGHQAASTADAYDVVLVDTIPVGLTYVTGSVNPPPAFVSFNAGTRKLTLGYSSLTLLDSSRTVTYQTRVNTDAAVGMPLLNAVDMRWSSQPDATGDNSGRTGADGSGGALNDYATATNTPVTPTASAVIAAGKAVAIVTDTAPTGVASSGDVLEYTVSLKNSGSSTVNNVVFTDPIPANTTYVPSSVNTTQGVLSTPATAVNVAVGSILPGGSVTITFRVTINAGVANGVVISNQGTVDSDETVPTPTDADGDPSNGAQPTEVTVGQPVGGGGTLYAQKTVSPAVVAAGGAVTYTITLKNTSSTATLSNIQFTDTVPSQVTVTSVSANASYTGQVVKATVASLAPGASVTITVTGSASNTATGTYNNQGAASYTDGATPGSTLTDSDGNPGNGNQPTPVTITNSTGPQLDVQKRWRLFTDTAPLGVPSPGDTLLYTVTVHNVGTATAQNVRFSDSVPTNTQLVANSAVTSQGIVTSNNTSPITANLGDMAAGATVTVSFQVTIDAAAADTVLANQANVKRTGDTTGVNSDDNGDSSDGLNPTLTPVYTTIVPPALAKTLAAASEPVTVLSDPQPQVLIGEVLTFQLAFTAPPGVTPQLVFQDTLPTGLAYVPNSARLSRTSTALNASLNPGGINSAASNTPVPLTDGVHLLATGQTLSVALGNVTNSDADPNTVDRYVLEYKARVQNIADNFEGRNPALSNSGTISYLNTLGAEQTLTPSAITLPIVEPKLNLAKTANPAALLSTGGNTTYTLVVTNTGSGPAYEVCITDPLTGWTVVTRDVSSAPSATQTPTGITLASNCNGSGQLQVKVDVFPAGGSLTLTIPVSSTDLSWAFPNGVDNTATTNWTSLPGATGTAGTSDGERTGAGSGVNSYTTSDSAKVTVDQLNLTKTVDSTIRHPIGDLVTYQLDISVPAGYTVNNAEITDALPSGLIYAGPVTRTDSNTAVLTTTSVTVNASDPTKPKFTLGTITNSDNSATRTLTLTYTARVQNVLSNQVDTPPLPNTATLTYYDPRNGGQPPNTLEDTESVQLGEPQLTLALDAAGPSGALTDLQAGDEITYTLTLGNASGPGVTTAFDTLLNTPLPTGMTGVAGSLQITASSGLDTATLNAILAALTLGSNGLSTVAGGFDLPPGASFTLSFKAKIDPTVLPGETIPATTAQATYTSLDGVNSTERTGSGTPAVNDYQVSDPAQAIRINSQVSFDKQFLPPTKSSYVVGEEVTYRLKVSLIEGTTKAVVVTDTLPAGLSYVRSTVGTGPTDGSMTIPFNPATDLTVTPPTGPSATGQVVKFTLGDIVDKPNAKRNDDYLTIDLTARVDNVVDNQAGTSLGNNAQLDYTNAAGAQTLEFDANGDPADGIQPLALTVTEPTVTLSKTASASSVSLGDTVTFTLTLSASGATAYDVKVTDQLPSGLEYISATGLTPTVNGQILTFDLAQLAQGDSKVITVTAKMRPDTTVGQLQTNQATTVWGSIPNATGDSTNGRNGQDSASGLNNYTAADSAAVSPTASAVIAAQKTVAVVADANGNGKADPGDTLQYTIVLSNNSSNTLNNVVFTDAIPANSEYVAGSSTPNGSFRDDVLTVNVGTLNANAMFTITFKVRINAATAIGTVISNQGVVDSDQTVPSPTDQDGNSNNGYQPTTIPVGGVVPALTADKSVVVQTDVAPVGVVNIGDTLRYTIVLRNNSTVALTGLTLSDPVPGGLTYVSANPIPSTVGSTLEWTNLSIAPGGSLTISFDVTIAVFADSEKTFSNQGSVSSPQSGTVPTDSNGDPSDGAQPTVITAVSSGTGAPRLDMQKSWSLSNDVAGDGTVNPADTLLYVLRLTNSGSTAAQDVRIVDTPLPSQVTLVAGSIVTSLGIVVSENPLTVNVGKLPAGQTVTVSFLVTVNANTGGQNAVNAATATAANVPDSINSNQTVTPIQGKPSLFDPPSGFKTVNAAGLPVLAWQMVWINNGNQDALTVRIVDTIPAGTTYDPGSVHCVARGASTVTRCEYQAQTNQIVYEGKIAADPGALDEATAQNEVLISFNSKLQQNVTSASNTASAYWDANNDGSVDNDIAGGQVPVMTNNGVATTWRVGTVIPTLSPAALVLLLGLLLMIGWRSLNQRQYWQNQRR